MGHALTRVLEWMAMAYVVASVLLGLSLVILVFWPFLLWDWLTHPGVYRRVRR